MPPVRRLVLGSDDRVWVELSEPGGTFWLVLDGEGLTPLFRVAPPEGLRGMAASGDTLWGVVTDELDVPYIVGYEAR